MGKARKATERTPAAAGYPEFLGELKARIQSARLSAARAVNRELILLYWDLGRGIVEKQRELGWGESVVETLGRDLQKAFPGTTGFSGRNLWYMRRFYEAYSDPEFLQQAVAEIKTGNRKPIQLEEIRQAVADIPWGHHVVILERISAIQARLYYLRATARFGWSRNVLLNQIKAGAYERTLAEGKTHNFPAVLPERLAEQAEEALKSSYVNLLNSDIQRALLILALILKFTCVMVISSFLCACDSHQGKPMYDNRQQAGTSDQEQDLNVDTIKALTLAFPDHIAKLTDIIDSKIFHNVDLYSDKRVIGSFGDKVNFAIIELYPSNKEALSDFHSLCGSLTIPIDSRKSIMNGTDNLCAVTLRKPNTEGSYVIGSSLRSAIIIKKANILIQLNESSPGPSEMNNRLKMIVDNIEKNLVCLKNERPVGSLSNR